MRTQKACCLTVRLRWDVALDHYHPQFTYTCAEDAEMAAAMARRAAEAAPRGVRFLGAEVSGSGGRFGPWEPLHLGACA